MQPQVGTVFYDGVALMMTGVFAGAVRQMSPRFPGPNHLVSFGFACRLCSMGCNLHRSCQLQP